MKIIRALAMLVVPLPFVACIGSVDEDGSEGEEAIGEDEAALCTTVSSVSVSSPVKQWWGTDYWESGYLYTTGCGSTYNIRVSTNQYVGGNYCASLRVKLYPSNGTPYAPRGWLYVCPYSGNVELANYILSGTKYRVESDNGAVTVSVTH